MSDETEWVLVPRKMTLDMEIAFCEAWFSKRRAIDDAEMEDAWAAALEAAPQPPAEAQPVAWMRRAARYRGVDGRQEGERIISESKVHDDDVPLYAHPPPSAPVGVDVGDKDCLTTRARELLADEYRKRGIGTGLVNDAGTATNVAIAAIATALAQQPAAAGEEIMVNAAHDVFTLPLQPSGLSSGPRFVVHVPAPEQPAVCAHSWHDYGTVPRAWCSRCNAVAVAGHEDRPYGVLSVSDDGKYRTDPIQQPAAVDDAMVERAAKELRDLHREFGDGADLPEKIALEIAEAVLAAALTAQPGGSDNDR